MAADGAGHGGPHAQGQHVGQRAGAEIAAHVDGVLQVLHRLPEEEAFGDAVQPLRPRQEAAVAVAHPPAGREGVERVGHGAHVLAQVQHGAILEEAAPLRVEAHQRHRAVQVAPGFGEDAAQHAGHGQDRRPHVEAEAALLQHRRLAAEPGILLQQHHAMTARRQHHRSRQPAQAPADHRDPSIADLPVVDPAVAHVTSPSSAFPRVPARPASRSRQGTDSPRSSASSRAVMRAPSKITGRPLPGWVPPPTR